MKRKALLEGGECGEREVRERQSREESRMTRRR